MRTLRISAINGGSCVTDMCWRRGVWAVTRAVDLEGNPIVPKPPARTSQCWVVTHVPSGCSATAGHMASKTAARKLARVLYRDFADWQRDAALGDSPPLPEPMKALVLTTVVFT